MEESLVQLVEESNVIYYAYILKEEGGSTKIVADSKAAKSETSRPIRKTCEGADINEVVFETGQSMIAEPIVTPCGEWIRALVPVYDNDKKRHHRCPGAQLFCNGVEYPPADSDDAGYCDCHLPPHSDDYVLLPDGDQCSAQTVQGSRRGKGKSS